MVVAGVLSTQLIAVMGKLGNLIGVWAKEETCKMLATNPPMLKPLGRKLLEEKLKEENMDIKARKRYLKFPGQKKIM